VKRSATAPYLNLPGPDLRTRFPWTHLEERSLQAAETIPLHPLQPEGCVPALELKVALGGTTSLEALHEPERGAPAPPDLARRGHTDRAGLEPRAPIPRFMVRMDAQKRKEAFHEPGSSGRESAHY